jgi:hypothetical protein
MMNDICGVLLVWRGVVRIMRIVLFGATGELGACVQDEALARGHPVTAAGEADGEGAVAVLAGHDAVVSCRGPEGLEDIIAGMRANGLVRIVVVTAGALREDSVAERLLAASGLRWTLACPTALTEDVGTGGYRAERDYLPEGGERIACVDAALFILDELESGAFVGSRVGIAE